MNHRLARVLIFSAMALPAIVIAAAHDGALSRTAGVQTIQCESYATHIEVTQAIQYDPRQTTESVPLLDYRSTTVRVYGYTLLGEIGCTTQYSVEGWLRILDGGQVVAQDYAENSGSVTWGDPNSPLDRSLEDSTLNFTFMLHSLSGQLTFEVLANFCPNSWYTGPCMLSPNWSSPRVVRKTISVVRKLTPKLRGFPVVDKFPGNDVFGRSIANLNTIDRPKADAQVWDMLPFPDGRAGGGYSLISVSTSSVVPTTCNVTIDNIPGGGLSFDWQECTAGFSSGALLDGDTIQWNNISGASRTLQNDNSIVRPPGCTKRVFSSVTIANNASATRTLSGGDAIGCYFYKSGTSTDKFDVLERDEYVINPNVLYELADVSDIFGGAAGFAREIDAVRQIERPSPDYLFGWVCCEDANPYEGHASGVSLVGKHAGHGTIQFDLGYRAMYPHELGHQFGFSQETAPSLNEVGWNVINRLHAFPASGESGPYARTKPEGVFTGFMQQGLTVDNSWINTTDWSNAILGGGGASGVYPEMTVNPTNALDLRRVVYPLTAYLYVEAAMSADAQDPSYIGTTFAGANYVEIVPGTSGDGLLQAFDASGAKIYQTNFVVPVGQATVEALLVPNPAQVARLELYRGGMLEDSKLRSEHAPIVVITSPEPSTTLTSGTIISWSIADDDDSEENAESFVTNISYSHDGGVSAIPLRALKRDGLGYRLGDVTDLPFSANGRIVVSVSDGLNTTSAEVTGLAVGQNHAPKVQIMHPAPAASYPWKSNVLLLGTAEDLEDGWVDVSTGAPIEPTISWYSSISGYLGSSSYLNTSGLPRGQHVIEMRAADSLGAISSAFVSVSIW